MKTSQAGLNLIQQSESLRLFPYRDVAGVLTIGWGHRSRPGQTFPTSISQDQADQYFAADVAAAESFVNGMVHVPLSQGQFDALVDFVFNLGAGRLAGSTLLRELNAGQYDSAGLQLLLWDHGDVNGTLEVVAGLQARRHAEFNLWRSKEALDAA